MAEQKAVGRRIARFDSLEKVTARAIFAADVTLPGMLVGKMLLSPHAHAEILSIDATRAESLPGVCAVITAADIPVVEKFNPDSRFHAFLARRFVVFAGQAVAAVAAIDQTTAEKALELIDVRYKQLPVVHDPEQAASPDSPLVSRESPDWRLGQDASRRDESYPPQEAAEKKTNVAQELNFDYGDIDAAFAQADVLIENTYTLPVVHQGYIEPHAVTAYWDQKDHVTVWECVQGAFAGRDLIASTLGLRQTQITLNTTEIGGGFGGKTDGIFGAVTVLLAKKARQPVQLILSRSEEMVGANPAPRSVVHIKTGVKKDGTLTGILADVVLDAGAFPSGWIMESVTVLLRNSYNFSAWRLRGREVLTNKASINSYRAPGSVNASFAIESQMDEMARQIGMDPFDLRLKNLTRKGDLLTTLEPQVEIGSQQVLETLFKHEAWRISMPERKGKDGRHYGRGMAFGIWDGSNGPAGAIAILEADGSFRIVLGTVDLTGSFTSLAQIAADALGVDVECVVITKASPDYVPFAPMSAGSQTIYAMGAAVKDAALDLRSKCLEQAAKVLETSKEDLIIDAEGIFLPADPRKRISFSDLYETGSQWYAVSGPLIGVGSASLRKRAPGSAACIVEVAVDPQTGVISLMRLTTAQDVGKAINPALVEGQMQGGSIQSVGMGLWEEVQYDQNGRVLNPSLLDYRMPTALDVPMIETIILETAGGDGPYGAKIVGEPPIISPAVAIANAVVDALGVRVYDLPITPERVWRALQRLAE